MQYGMDRFVIPLRERKDLVSPNDHRTLFQNIDEVSKFFSIYKLCLLIKITFKISLNSLSK